MGGYSTYLAVTKYKRHPVRKLDGPSTICSFTALVTLTLSVESLRKLMVSIVQIQMG